MRIRCSWEAFGGAHKAWCGTVPRLACQANVRPPHPSPRPPLSHPPSLADQSALEVVYFEGSLQLLEEYDDSFLESNEFVAFYDSLQKWGREAGGGGKGWAGRRVLAAGRGPRGALLWLRSRAGVRGRPWGTGVGMQWGPRSSPCRRGAAAAYIAAYGVPAGAERRQSEGGKLWGIAG